MHPALLYAVTVLIWGSSWIGIKMQLGVVAPQLSIAYRFVLAAGILLAFCAATGRSLRFSARDHLFLAAQGLTLFCLNYLLFYVAGGWLTSGLLAVCFSTITVMNIANGALFFRQGVDGRVVVAAVLGLAGLGLVFWPEVAGFSFSHQALVGLALPLLATYSASLGNMVSVRHKRAGIPVVESNALGMTYGAAASLLISLVSGAPLVIETTAAYLGSLIYLAVFATIIGFGAYLTLLQKIGADRAAYATVLFPILALGISTVFEGYRWSVPAMAGLALVLLGNLLVLMPRRAAPAPSGSLAAPGPAE